MPVDDDIHVVVERVLHSVLHKCLKLLPVTICAVATAFVGVHGEPHHVCSKAFQRGKTIIGHILWIPRKTVCADSAKLHLVVILINELAALHMQLTVY